VALEQLLVLILENSESEAQEIILLPPSPKALILLQDIRACNKLTKI